MKLTVYGIPTCSTVKKAVKWLSENGFEYDWVDLRKQPPSREQLEEWMDVFGFKPMRNTSGGAYRKLGPQRNDYDSKDWLAAFSQEPMLLKRPIVLVDGKPALVGFKADQYQAVLKS